MKKLGLSGHLSMPVQGGAASPTCEPGTCVWSPAENALMCWDGSTWEKLGGDAGAGPQGPAGPTGAAGPAGPQGPPGSNGAAGGQGPAGATGSQGPQGPAGTNGAAGAQGIQGIQGIQGPQGTAGAQGPAGPAYATRVVLGGDISSSVTALGDATGLSFAVTSGVRHRFCFWVVFRSAALTTGIQLSVNAPAATLLAYNAIIPITATTQVLGNRRAVNVASVGTGVDVVNSDLLATVEGVIVPSASGTLALRYSSEVAASAVTMRAGSHGELVILD